VTTLTLRDLVKDFGRTRVVDGIGLDVAAGEFIVLVGPSGCGKSTTLRMIAGLEEVTAGTIAIGGRVINDLEPKDRDIAMVFQNYAIYPHLTVRQNIGFGLYTQRLARAEKARRIEEAAAILGMGEFLERKPAALSGGQRQRVAIGRAMVRNPRVFLFDEPLSNLDAQLRTQMRIEIKKLHARLASTIVYVTHDQVEAMTLADRIVIMKEGRIQQVGSPAEVYHAPANSFVATFIGAPAMNLLPGTAAGGWVRLATGSEIAVATGAGGPVLLGIRPEDLRPAAAGGAALAGRVTVAEPLGPGTLLHVDLGGAEVIATGPGRGAPAPGATVGLAFDPAALHLFDAATGAAIR